MDTAKLTSVKTDGNEYTGAPLSKAQHRMLHTMLLRGGEIEYWDWVNHDYAGPYSLAVRNSNLIFDALVRRGLIERIDNEAGYALTDAGSQLALKLGRP